MSHTLLARVRNRALSAAGWLRDSLWLIPGLMTSAAVALAFITVSLDLRFDGDALDRDMWFVFGVGPDGVRSMLSTIAGSIITVTGVVFSITIVALQLASTQYSPRVLRTFLEDRITHVVLGVFIGTFTYCLLVLRTVRAESGAVPEFVPSLSATVALVLGLVSVGFLIFFVHHSAQSIRGAVIVRRLTEAARATVDRAFPRGIGEAGGPAAPEQASRGRNTPVRARGPGYLNAIDETGLLALHDTRPVVLRMCVRLGDYVRTGDTLATVEGMDVNDEASARVRDAFRLGPEAAGDNDMSLGLIRLSEVATRALSPGINDLGTAGACLDAISEVMVRLGCRDAPHPVRASAGGNVILVARYAGFAELLELALGPIRHFGAGIPPIMLKLIATIRSIGLRVHPNRRSAVLRQLVLARRAADCATANDDARAQLGRAARDAAHDIGQAPRHRMIPQPP